jgi:anti-sigma regulatory factor (Ser/Thr protein kinase)
LGTLALMKRVLHARLRDARQLAGVRRTVGESLATVGVEGHSHAVNLVLSELVTNALLYGEPPFVVTVTVDDNSTSIFVEDAGSEFPSRRPTVPGEPGGYGLNLVDAAANGWGVIARQGDGKVVWAEIPHQYSFAPRLSVDA